MLRRRKGLLFTTFLAPGFLVELSDLRRRSIGRPIDNVDNSEVIHGDGSFVPVVLHLRFISPDELQLGRSVCFLGIDLLIHQSSIDGAINDATGSVVGKTRDRERRRSSGSSIRQKGSAVMNRQLVTDFSCRRQLLGRRRNVVQKRGESVADRMERHVASFSNKDAFKVVHDGGTFAQHLDVMSHILELLFGAHQQGLDLLSQLRFVVAVDILFVGGQPFRKVALYTENDLRSRSNARSKEFPEFAELTDAQVWQKLDESCPVFFLR